MDAPEPVPSAQESVKLVVLDPVVVEMSVLGSIGVLFTLEGTDVDDPADPIVWASVTDVPKGGPGERAGLKNGDELIRLNEVLIRGLTIRQLATLIVRVRKQGNMLWTVRRGLLGTTFTTVFNGKHEPSEDQRKPGKAERAQRPKGALPEGLATFGTSGEQMEGAGHDRPLKLLPFNVLETVYGTIEVRFVLRGQNLADSLNDPIQEANVANVDGAGSGRRGLEVGDSLVGLKGTPIKGMTVHELAVLVTRERSKGDLIWNVKRGLTTFPRRFNGRWQPPLPEVATKG